MAEVAAWRQRALAAAAQEKGGTPQADIDGLPMGGPESPFHPRRDSPTSTSGHLNDSFNSTDRSTDDQSPQRQDRRRPWDPYHHNPRHKDMPGMPGDKRRYFSDQHAELARPVAKEKLTKPKPPEKQQEQDSRPPWDDTWYVSPSVDNHGLHKLFRHYFDRRGAESCYRARPALQPYINDFVEPRSRPSTSERIERGLSRIQSTPAMEVVTCPSLQTTARSTMASTHSAGSLAKSTSLDASARSNGSIHWMQRCNKFGVNKKVGKSRFPGDPVGKSPEEKIPWVWNHHVSDHEDKEFMNASPRTWTGAGIRHSISCHSEMAQRNVQPIPKHLPYSWHATEEYLGAGSPKVVRRNGEAASHGSLRRSPQGGHRLPMPGSTSWVHEAKAGKHAARFS